MDFIMNIIVSGNSILWGTPALVLLFVVGLYLTFGSKFIVFRKIKFIFKNTLGSLKSNGEGAGTISKVAAVCTSLAATVGMGNIVGVASALIVGGPGAVFWMILAALMGMVMKFFEVCLCIHFREKNADGEYYGGPALYMSKGLNAKWLGMLIIVMTVIACLGSNMIQTNVLITNLRSSLPSVTLPVYAFSIVVTLAVAAVIIGGIKRLGKVSEILVPIMAILYLVGGVVVLVLNASAIPESLMLIFKGAFSPVAIGGGALGYGFMLAARYGIARGFFSNGGGQACYCIAHAPATVEHPVEQGIWAVTEVFIDCLICLITALAILTSGIPLQGANSALLASQAFGATFSSLQLVISVAIILFTFTTVIGFCYMGESQLNLIFKPSVVKIFRYVFLCFTFAGALIDITLLWDICDFIFGIIMFINLPVLVILSPLVFKMTREFFAARKQSTHE